MLKVLFADVDLLVFVITMALVVLPAVGLIAYAFLEGLDRLLHSKRTKPSKN